MRNNDLRGIKIVPKELYWFLHHVSSFVGQNLSKCGDFHI